MQPLVAQLLLPVVLAAIMLGMGLSLTSRDFQRITQRPRAMLAGLAGQLVLLPLLALLIIACLPLQPMAATGLFLVALCPGGATSNLFSYLARGDVALSVSLTALSSLLSPLLLPAMLLAYLTLTGHNSTAFQLSLMATMKQLALVTLLPIGLGMLLRRLAPDWAQRSQPIIKQLAITAMIAIVITLMATHLQVLPDLLSVNGAAVLLLSGCALLLAYQLAGLCPVSAQQRRTIALEVGVQNAGTAMMVALAILQQPALALMPLLYGLLMNLPAFAFVAWCQRESKTLADQ